MTLTFSDAELDSNERAAFPGPFSKHPFAPSEHHARSLTHRSVVPLLPSPSEHHADLHIAFRDLYYEMFSLFHFSLEKEMKTKHKHDKFLH